MDEDDRVLEPIRTGRPTRPLTTRSANSSRSRRSRSRPRSPLQRIYSSHYLDDHNVYDHEHAAHSDSEREEEEEADSDNALESQDSSLDEKKEKEEEDQDPDIVPEIQGAVPDERELDLEAQGPKLERRATTKSIKDPNLVTWDGPDDPANPKNWSLKQKWAATLVVSSFTFISPVSSSMVAPALSTISADFNIKSTAEEQLVLSIFVLAYAIGPLFLGPMSELYGRVRVLQLANAFYFVWNLACGFATSSGQMMAFRFLAGLGGSAPLAIGGGLLSDCWRAEERGKAISIYSLAPLLGPAIGPIAGGFITENT